MIPVGRTAGGSYSLRIGGILVNAAGQGLAFKRRKGNADDPPPVVPEPAA